MLSLLILRAKHETFSPYHVVHLKLAALQLLRALHLCQCAQRIFLTNGYVLTV